MPHNYSRTIAGTLLISPHQRIDANELGSLVFQGKSIEIRYRKVLEVEKSMRGRILEPVTFNPGANTGSGLDLQATLNPGARTGSGLDLLALVATSVMDSKDTNTQAHKASSTSLHDPGPYNPTVAIPFKVVKKILDLEFVEMAEITLDDDVPSTPGRLLPDRHLSVPVEVLHRGGHSLYKVP